MEAEESCEINSWRVILVAGAVSLLIIYFIWWGRMIGNPADRSGADLIAFYTAGRVAQEHGFASVYNIEYQQMIQQELVGFQLAQGQVLLYNHLPYLVPLLALIVDDNYVGSFQRWVLVLLSIYLIGTRFFVRSLFPADQAAMRLSWFIGAITFFPLFISLWQGQDTAFLYLGVVLWCIGILKKQDWLIGAGLALATVRPHLSIALAAPLRFGYQRALWRSILLISILAIISVLILNLQGTVDFLNLIRIELRGKLAWDEARRHGQFAWFPVANCTIYKPCYGFSDRMVDLPGWHHHNMYVVAALEQDR